MAQSKKSIILIVVVVLIVVALGVGIFLITKPAPQRQNLTLDLDSITLDKLTEPADLQMWTEVKEQLKADPKNVDALLKLAILQKYNGSYEDGVKTLLIAKESMPDNVLIYNNLGEMYILAKDFPAAEQTYLDLLNISSQWINAYVWLGTIYKEEMPEVYKTDKYPNLLKKGLAEGTGPNQADYYLMLGSYYRDVDNKAEAISWYQKYLQIKPDDQDVRKELEKLQ